MSGGWRVLHRSGTAGQLHEPWVPEPIGPTVGVLTVCEPALVLGSTQRVEQVVRADPPSIAVVRRGSGGGAVLLEPGEHTWVDLFLPRLDRRWSDDVVVAPEWVGEVWASVVGGFGLRGTVHQGRWEADELGRLVCFAGRGPGEVTVGGRKLVGLSQRRTREGVRFQCLLHRRFDAPRHAALLGPGIEVAELADRVAVLDAPPSVVAEAFIDALGRGVGDALGGGLGNTGGDTRATH